MREKNIDKIVAEHEYWLAKYKFVQEKYPGCNVHAFYSPVTFSSKLVNPNYTKFNISTGYNTLFIEPYVEVEFEHAGKREILQVFTSPRRNRLAHITYPKEDPNQPKKSRWQGKRIIKFTKFKNNLVNRDMSADCWNDCRAAIMKFIKDNSGMDLDTKHLDPSLKKLMIFN